jgi:hypothetical protein
MLKKKMVKKTDGDPVQREEKRLKKEIRALLKNRKPPWSKEDIDNSINELWPPKEKV